jgi:hypothetical protein
VAVGALLLYTPVQCAIRYTTLDEQRGPQKVTQRGVDSMPGDTWKITTFGELNETSSTAKTLAVLLRLPRWLSTRLQHTLHVSSARHSPSAIEI